MIQWKGYEWMNGQPWGEAHPNKDIVWYADDDMIRFSTKDELIMRINNTPKHFEGEVNHEKPFGGACISTKETFLYGDFHFEYKLPRGIHLWPAIWLSGSQSWPPEIDIMEGWSGNGYICKNKPNYKRFPLFNNIHPSVYFARDDKKVYGKGYGNFNSDRATYSWLQKLDEWNTCDLKWRKDSIEVYYNGHKVMKIDENDEEYGFYILDGIKKEMYICIDFAVTNKFTQEDYKQWKKEGTPFIVKEFTYTPAK